MSLICLLLYRFAETVGVGFIGGCVAATLLLSTIWQSVHSIVRQPSAIESRSANPAHRPVLLGSIACGLVSLALLTPLPRSVVAPAVIDATGSVDVFLQTPGELVSALPPGTQVRQGDEIAKFRNLEKEQELLALDSKRQMLQTELASLQQRRTSDPGAAGRIASVSEALEAANNDYQLQRVEAERLLIRAPKSGLIFAPRNRHQITSDEQTIQTWHDTPLKEQNKGSFFQEATLLCRVGDANGREAIVLVRQQDIALVRAGQSVQLLTATHSRPLLRNDHRSRHIAHHRSPARILCRRLR